MLNLRIAASVVCAQIACAPAIAAPKVSTEFGIDFVTIGRPGNRGAFPEERFYNNPHYQNLGSVNYRYRLSRTEITSEQWVDFANAYEPYWAAAGGSRINPGFTGGWLNPQTLNPNLPANYSIAAGAELLAVQVQWRVAAIFCNWLHNGKVNEAWAFQSGAYDVSTFGSDPNGGYTDQESRSPGARFWIPSVDEWTKGAHYDPNRYGEGMEGYWLRMGSQNEPLIPGLPENGGQTSSGDFLPGFDEQFIPVGSYAHVPGPWGVLDTSGGVQEWTETIRSGFDLRFARGSGTNNTQYANFDVIDWYSTLGGPDHARNGMRLASAVPSAPLPAMLLGAIGAAGARRRC